MITILEVIFSIISVIPVFAMNDSLVVNDGYGDYLLVPAGEFQMGDNFNEGGTASRPVHTVYLDSFYVGKYEVTNAEYSKFVADSGYSDSLYWSSYHYKSFGSQPKYWNDSLYMGSHVRGGGIKGNENFPVVGVNRYEAEAYCMWLSKKTGKTYRLPTEAEWEKAARGTDQRRYPWGNDIDSHYANYKDSGDPYDNGLAPVGYFDGSNHNGYQTKNNASPYRAYDMAGNVWELISDWYSQPYYAVSPFRNPKGPLNPITVYGDPLSYYGISRGGCYDNSSPNSLRSANRYI